MRPTNTHTQLALYVCVCVCLFQCQRTGKGVNDSMNELGYVVTHSTSAVVCSNSAVVNLSDCVCVSVCCISGSLVGQCSMRLRDLQPANGGRSGVACQGLVSGGPAWSSWKTSL